MENTEEVFQCLDDFVKRKPKTIPRELEEYLAYVARTGDPVYQWSLVKYLFKEKLLNVITDFYETSPGLDIPHCPNVDPFNYDTMKNSLLERLDSFSSAPFTVQRLCELLTTPRKLYNRIDKFMRAIEKNVLVVSTREPGPQRHNEPENGDQMESMVNGSDNTSDYNVDVEMEDMSWKENSENSVSQPQPGSSDGHISVDDIEARLQAKESQDIEDKTTKEYESVTPPEPNIPEESNFEKTVEEPVLASEHSSKLEKDETETEKMSDLKEESKIEEDQHKTLNIPEIKIDDAEMTEKNLEAKNTQDNKQSAESPHLTELVQSDHTEAKENVSNEPVPTPPSSEKSVEQEMKEVEHDLKDTDLNETKMFSEVSTSSEESSSSSDNTDGNSNSPKPDSVTHIDVQEETDRAENHESDLADKDLSCDSHKTSETSETSDEDSSGQTTPKMMHTDDYSISDVKSELPQISTLDKEKTLEATDPVEEKPENASEMEKTEKESIPDNLETESEKTNS